jgi:hypothetical protein
VAGGKKSAVKENCEMRCVRSRGSLQGLSLFAPVQSSPGLLNEGDILPARGSERRRASGYAWASSTSVFCSTGRLRRGRDRYRPSRQNAEYDRSGLTESFAVVSKLHTGWDRGHSGRLRHTGNASSEPRHTLRRDRRHLPAGHVHRQSWHHPRSGDKDPADETVGDKDMAGV